GLYANDHVCLMFELVKLLDCVRLIVPGVVKCIVSKVNKLNYSRFVEFTKFSPILETQLPRNTPYIGEGIAQSNRHH
ncbi:hypothetical protein DD595_25585, partial [Enterobacter cloacae complex sp. 4DZ3-17B2]